MTDHDTLTGLLRVASRQSKPFQSLIHDYAADVMADPETHRLFSERLAANPSVRTAIEDLKASVGAEVGPLSPAMEEVLASVNALPSGSHTNTREIADLAAAELVYKLRETARAC